MSHPEKPTPDPKAEVRRLKAERRQIVNAGAKLHAELEEMYLADLLPESAIRRVAKALRKWDCATHRQIPG